MHATRSKYVGWPAVLAVSALVLSGCGTTTQQTEATSIDDMEPIVLDITDHDPEQSVIGEALHAMADQVEEDSDGKITFDFYMGGALMPGEETLSGVGSGAVDLGRVVAAYHPSELPAANWFESLGADHSLSYPHGLVQGALTSSRMFVEEGPLRAELEAQNVVPLMSYTPAQQSDLLCTEPIETLEDASGTRARATPDLHVEAVNSLDMVPVSVPINETYEALQRGMVDCVMTTVPGYQENGLWEIATHYTPVNAAQLHSLPLVINADVWESLPEDAQQILQDGANTAMIEATSQIVEYYHAFAEEGVTEHDITFQDPREFDEVLARDNDARIEDLITNAPSSIEDPEAFISAFRSSHDEWLTLLEDTLSLPESERDSESIKESFAGVEARDLDPFWDAALTVLD